LKKQPLLEVASSLLHFHDFISLCENKIIPEVIEMENFSYYEYWASEEQEQIQNRRRIRDNRDKIGDLPVSPALTRLEETIRRIEHLYNLAELDEEGVDVVRLLKKYTEIQLLDFLELNGCELSITMEEVENLLFDNNIMLACEV
jgi:hypothetical protein